MLMHPRLSLVHPVGDLSGRRLPPTAACWRTYPHTAYEFLRHLIRLASQLCEGFFGASQRMDYQLIGVPCASRATECDTAPDSSLASLLSVASENQF
jgi:hypothetical protein